MKILVVGGVAGGMSCAARARRLDEKAEIVVLERSGYVSFANCGLPYHIGGEIVSRDELLLQTPESLGELLNIDVRVRSEAVSIDPKGKTARVRNLAENKEYTESYDKLVLAPGASPFKPATPGIENPRIMTLRNVEDMDAIKKAVDAQGVKTAAVVGGGYIGVEIAENLVMRGIKVHVVEMLDQVLAQFDKEMAQALQNHMESKGLSLYLGSPVCAFKDAGGKLSVELQDGTAITADIAILAVGVKPDTKLAADTGLELNSRGGIKVNAQMLTSAPDIYAVGDAVEVVDPVTRTPAQIPLAGPANRQGRIAADNICGLESSYKGTWGTSILKVFDMCGACVGASEKNLRRAGIAYSKAYLHPLSHAEYYPGASRMHLKLLFSEGDGKILGAQAVGFDGVDKRIDVISTAIKASMTVFDLEELELSYAPPFGSAKDAVNMAGFVASNILHGLSECWFSEDFPSRIQDGILIDVRPKDHYEFSHLPGAINIPFSKFRSRLSEIPRDKNIFLYCRVGFSSYMAYRILRQNGYGSGKQSIRTLSGGILTFSCVHPSVVPTTK